MMRRPGDRAIVGLSAALATACKRARSASQPAAARGIPGLGRPVYMPSLMILSTTNFRMSGERLAK